MAAFSKAEACDPHSHTAVITCTSHVIPITYIYGCTPVGWCRVQLYSTAVELPPLCQVPCCSCYSISDSSWTSSPRSAHMLVRRRGAAEVQVQVAENVSSTVCRQYVYVSPKCVSLVLQKGQPEQCGLNVGLFSTGGLPFVLRARRYKYCITAFLRRNDL